MALEHGMIEPFEDRQVRQGVISYGLSSYGYDIRVADEFKVFTNINSTVVDPKNFDARSFVDLKTDICIIPPKDLEGVSGLLDAVDKVFHVWGSAEGIMIKFAVVMFIMAVVSSASTWLMGPPVAVRAAASYRRWLMKSRVAAKPRPSSGASPVRKARPAAANRGPYHGRRGGRARPRR